MKPTRRELLAAAAKLPALLLVATPAARLLADTPAAPAFTAHQSATLHRIARLLFPIDGLGDGPYERTVAALAGQADVVTEGVAALDELANGRYLDLPEQRQVALLKEMEGGGFFSTALETTRIGVLNDPETWAVIGYGGSSLEFGGYIDHGLADIDWLPEFPESEGAGHE